MKKHFLALLTVVCFLLPLQILAQQATPPEGEQRALEKAQQIHRELLRGANFAEMARKYSDDPGSREKGGELGYIEQGWLEPAYEEAALRLSEGEFTEPVKTEFGYHIIQLIGIREGEFNTRHILIKPEKAGAAGDQE
ncbi:MAG: peptidylprolyl isomerase [Cyclobacteriaceae bacterium]